MCLMASSKQNKTDIDNPVVYLVSGILGTDKDFKKGSLKPINDVFIGLKQEGNTVKDLQLDGMDVKTKASFDSTEQVYLTNNVGAVCNFETGKTLDADQAQLSAFMTSGAINPFEKEAQLYFPPQHLVQYSLAKKGYAGWVDDLRDSLNDISSEYQQESFMVVKPQAVSVAESFIDPKTKGFKCSGAYRTWYQTEINALKTNPEKKVTVLAMARTRAVLVTFSSKKYENATVSISKRNGNPAFLTKLPKTDQDLVLDKTKDDYEVKVTAEVKPIRDTKENLLGYGAVFYDALATHDKAQSVEDQIYQIKVGFKITEGKNSLGAEFSSYTLMERIRFPIESTFGEYDVINGDAISVEETLIKQFPLQYPHIIKKASESRTYVGIEPPAPLAGTAGFQFNMQTALDKTKLTGDVLSGSAMMGLRKLGTAIWAGVDEKSTTLRDSVNLAFSVYDVANKLPDLMNTAVGSVEVGIQGADVLKEVKNTQQLAPSLSAELDDLIKQQAAKHPIPDKLLKLSRSAGKAIDAMGPALDAFNVFNDAAALSVTWKDLNTVTNNYQSILNDYAHKVLVVSNAAHQDDNDLTVEQEKEQRDKIDAFIKENKDLRVVEPFGDGYVINARFDFDRAKFLPDESFDAITEFLSSINHNALWLTLEGHTCNLGTDEYNHQLGQRRADSVEIAIREKIGSSKILIDAISKGQSEPLVENSSDKNRARNRRVYAYFKFKRMNQYLPSREGIAQIEHLRSLTTLKKSALPDDLKKTVLSVLDCMAGVPPLNPAHAAFSVLWLVGGVLVDAASFLDKAIHGEALVKTIDEFGAHNVSSATNQLLLLKSPDGRMSTSKYLDAQFRMRAEAMNGLMALLMRCSIEKSGEGLERFEDEGKFDDDPRTGLYDSLFGKYRNGFGYQENLEIYHVEEYVKRFILNDGWQLTANPIFPMSLDNYWIYLIRTKQLNAKPQLPSDAQWYEKALEAAANITDAAVDIWVSIDDYGDQFKTLTKNFIIGCDYIYSNQQVKGNPDRKDILGANFQNLFPVHHVESESFAEFSAALVPDFTGLNTESVVINTLSVRKRGSTGKQGWIPMGDWLHANSKVSPFDQIRICVILDPKDKAIAQLIKDDVITYVPVDACPVRVDGINMEGPSVAGSVRKLSFDDLTADEKKLIEGVVEEADLYGVIITPHYMLGNNVMYGTKPMANTFSALLNVTDEHTLRSIYNWDHSWSMDYEFEVELGGVPDSKTTSSYYKDIKIGRNRGQSRNLTEFKMMLGANENGSTKFYNNEGILLDRHFLQVGKEREALPELFKGAETYCLVRPKGLGDFLYSDTSWQKEGASANSINNRNELEIKNYNWHSGMQLSILIVADEIDTEAYKKRNVSHKNIPGMIQLYRKGANQGETDLPVDAMYAMDPLDIINPTPVHEDISFLGPTYEVAFKEMGIIQLNSNDDLEFNLAPHLKGEDGTLNKANIDLTTKQLLGAITKDNRLAFLSGGPNSSSLEKPQSKHVYIATLDLDYQSLTGELVDGLKPFKVFAENRDDIQDDWRWNFNVKVTTQGDSGFSNDKVNGSYSLPYPKDLFDLGSRWYKPSQSAKSLALEKIEKNIEILAEYKILERKQRRPIYISPLIKWLSLGDDDLWTDEKKASLHNWLNQQGSSRFLSYSKNRVMEDESDIEKRNEAESA